MKYFKSVLCYLGLRYHTKDEKDIYEKHKNLYKITFPTSNVFKLYEFKKNTPTEI